MGSTAEPPARGATTFVTPAILLIDDHGPGERAVEWALRPLEHRLVRARSVSEALAEAARGDLAVIVVDVASPDADGFAAIELLRGRPRLRDVPIVFVPSSDALEEQAARAYDLGVAECVRRPLDPVALRAKVASLVAAYLRGRRHERARLEETGRHEDAFLAALSHDLRAPLQTIVMGSTLLCEENATEEERRTHADAIDHATTRMRAMLDDLLDLGASRFTGTIPIRRRTTDLAAICRDVVAEIRSAHPGRSIELEAAPDLVGEWDPSRLGRVIANLAGNAVQHAPEASIRVRLAEEDGQARVTVHNDGPAIAPEALPLLFEPFRRGVASGQGWGLGLYVVREVVRAHGGSVQVDSREGSGTTFVVTLPRAPSTTPEPVDAPAEGTSARRAARAPRAAHARPRSPERAEVTALRAELARLRAVREELRAEHAQRRALLEHQRGLRAELSARRREIEKMVRFGPPTPR